MPPAILYIYYYLFTPSNLVRLFDGAGEGGGGGGISGTPKSFICMYNKTDSTRLLGEKSAIFCPNDHPKEYSDVPLKMHISQKRYMCVFKETLLLRCHFVASVRSDENEERRLLYSVSI